MSPLALLLSCSLLFPLQRFVTAQDTVPSSHGNEFVVGFAEALAEFLESQQTQILYVNTLEPNPVSFMVTGNGFEMSETAPPDSTVSVTIPNQFSVQSPNERNKGIRVKAEGNRTIAVSAITTYRFSADGFMALPCNNFGFNEYVYFGLSYSLFSTNYPSLILLVACEDNTIVTSRFVNITLNKQETYQIESENDLTGVRIASSKHLSVFSGHTCARIPTQNTNFCEHLIEQIPPTETWGSRFLVTSLMARSSGEIIRVLSASAAEVIVYCSSASPLVNDTFDNPGSYIEFVIPPNDYCTIEATSPVLVAQYAYGSDADNSNGDPFMMVLPPIEQYSNTITFTSFTAYSDNYVTIYVPAEFYQPERIIFDGSAVPNGWVQVPCSFLISCGYALKMAVSVGRHSVFHQDSSSVLGVSVYGSDTTIISYGTSGDYNLNPLSTITPSPIVSVSNELSPQGSFRQEDAFNTYSVARGHRFGLVCESEWPIVVKWVLADDNTPVEERSRDMGLPLDYSGQLYLYRESHSRAVLRTLVFSNNLMGEVETGMRDRTDGRAHHYKCVASIVGNTAEIAVKLAPTELMGNQYTRFSAIPSELTRLGLAQPEPYTAHLSYRVVKAITAVLPSSSIEQSSTAQCEHLSNARRVVDAENGWSRYECVVRLQSSNSSDLVQKQRISDTLRSDSTISSSSINQSPNGFCDSELNAEIPQGVYNWSEVQMEETLSHPCFYANQDMPNDMAMITRSCLGPRSWGMVESGGCITLATSLFQQLRAMLPVTFANIVEILEELESIVLSAVNIDDQIADNQRVILEVLTEVADVVSQRQHTVTLEDVIRIINVIDAISIWPPSEIRDFSSDIVLAFDTIAENMPPVTATISRPWIVFRTQTASTMILQQDGFTFNSSTLEAGGSMDGNLSSFQLAEDDVNKLSVFLPSEIFNNTDPDTPTRLAFFVYPTSVLFPLDESLGDAGFAVGTPVMGAIVAEREEIVDLMEPVVITLPVTVEFSEDNVARCVSWNYSAGPIGNWSEVGCRVRQIDTGNRTIACECDHLTNFAILLDIDARLRSPQDDLALSIISYIGSISSIIGLVVTLITLIGSKKLRNLDNTKFQIQFCISLICMLLVYLIGTSRSENEGFCTFMSGLLQYFVLSTVFLMAAQAVLMFRKLVLVFGVITTRFIIAVSLTCWLLPLLFVVAAFTTIASGTNTMIFRSSEDNRITICFISNIYVLIGTLLIPVYLTLLLNFVVFFAVLGVLIKKMRSDRSTAAANFKLTLGIFSISVVLGLTWIFGAFIASDASIVFRYLFVICNAFQGFLFFVFVTVIGTEGRLFWAKLLRLDTITKGAMRKSFKQGTSTVSMSSKQASSKFDSIKKNGVQEDTMKRK